LVAATEVIWDHVASCLIGKQLISIQPKFTLRDDEIGCKACSAPRYCGSCV
jgi:hypothetical protein